MTNIIEIQKEVETDTEWEENFLPERPISVLEVLNEARQLHLASDLFETLGGQARVRVGKWLYYHFGVDVSANGIEDSSNSRG